MAHIDKEEAIVWTVVFCIAFVLWFFVARKEALQEPVPVVFEHTKNEQSLFGYAIIIDPGHGGDDPGAHGIFRGKQVYEAPYVMDVARRLALEVKSRGGIALLTRHNPKVNDPSENPPSQILPLTRDDVFRSDGSRVRAGKDGMEQRLATAHDALRHYPDHRVIFVSIHFDAESPRLKGTYVIVPEGKQPAVADALLTSFGQVKRLRKRKEGLLWKDYIPVLVNGTVRNLYILREDKNPIEDRVLIELGNFGNKDDVWRIRDPKVRRQYAEAITAGLEHLGD